MMSFLLFMMFVLLDATGHPYAALFMAALMLLLVWYNASESR